MISLQSPVSLFDHLSMTYPIIPILRQGNPVNAIRPAIVLPGTDSPVLDRLGRPLKDLRISVTDRCNFRCVYCMPKQVFGKDFKFIPPSDMLSFEEITRLARLFVSHGVEKIPVDWRRTAFTQGCGTPDRTACPIENT